MLNFSRKEATPTIKMYATKKANPDTGSFISVSPIHRPTRELIVGRLSLVIHIAVHSMHAHIHFAGPNAEEQFPRNWIGAIDAIQNRRLGIESQIAAYGHRQLFVCK